MWVCVGTLIPGAGSTPTASLRGTSPAPNCSIRIVFDLPLIFFCCLFLLFVVTVAILGIVMSIVDVANEKETNRPLVVIAPYSSLRTSGWFDPVALALSFPDYLSQEEMHGMDHIGQYSSFVGA
jgi:hypothetical protein